ncbi:MAG TPA: hypothetical protein VMJ10_10360, partial [Kofleriaceae bacterium]|nr:hypothetical protein [Kofleriaceae bacterium]
PREHRHHSCKDLSLKLADCIVLSTIIAGCADNPTVFVHLELVPGCLQTTNGIPQAWVVATGGVYNKGPGNATGPGPLLFFTELRVTDASGELVMDNPIPSGVTDEVAASPWSLCDGCDAVLSPYALWDTQTDSAGPAPSGEYEIIVELPDGTKSNEMPVVLPGCLRPDA